MPTKNQNVPKKSNREILTDFGSIFGPCQGVRGAEDTWKYRIDSNNQTCSLPWWGAADDKSVLNPFKIYETSRLRHGCNFWATQASQKTPTWSNSRSQLAQFGDHFPSTIERMMSKKASEFLCRRRIENECQKGSKIMPKSMPNLNKSHGPFEKV